MKRIFYSLIFLLCLSLNVSAMSPAVLGCAGGSAGVADPCGCLASTYMLCYTGDYSGNAAVACKTNGAGTVTGTVVDATVSADYVSVSANNDYISFAVTDGDIINDELGTIFFSVYITDEGDATVEDNALIEVNTAVFTEDKIFCVVLGASDKIRCYHEGGNAGDISATSSSTITTGAWYRVGYTWDTTNDKHSVSLVTKTSATSWTEESEALTPFTNQPTAVKIGELSSGIPANDIPILIADMVILSTYQATDPNP